MRANTSLLGKQSVVVQEERRRRLVRHREQRLDAQEVRTVRTHRVTTVLILAIPQEAEELAFPQEAEELAVDHLQEAVVEVAAAEAAVAAAAVAVVEVQAELDRLLLLHLIQ